MLKPPKGILFDLGDTILRQHVFDKEMASARLLELADNPKGVSPQAIIERAKALDRELIPRREKAMIEFPAQSIQRLLYEPLGITFSLSPMEIELEFWKAANQMAPDPGLDEVLDTLQQRQIAKGIVSNSIFSGQVLLWELKQHGLADRFRFLMSSADYGFRKPHPFLFHTVVAKLGLQPEDVWFVGDSHAHDIVGAVNAGLGAVLYIKGTVPPDIDPQPHAVARTWKEFLALLHRSW